MSNGVKFQAKATYLTLTIANTSAHACSVLISVLFATLAFTRLPWQVSTVTVGFLIACSAYKSSVTITSI